MCIRERLAEIDEEFLMADGFEDAIIGITSIKGHDDIVCYDYEKCVEILLKDGDMTDETAREYMEYNVIGAYLGPRTPSFLRQI